MEKKSRKKVSTDELVKAFKKGIDNDWTVQQIADYAGVSKRTIQIRKKDTPEVIEILNNYQPNSPSETPAQKDTLPKASKEPSPKPTQKREPKFKLVNREDSKTVPLDDCIAAMYSPRIRPEPRPTSYENKPKLKFQVAPSSLAWS